MDMGVKLKFNQCIPCQFIRYTNLKLMQSNTAVIMLNEGLVLERC